MGTILGPGNPLAWTVTGRESLSGKCHYMFSSPKTVPWNLLLISIRDLAPVCWLNQKSLMSKTCRRTSTWLTILEDRLQKRDMETVYKILLCSQNIGQREAPYLYHKMNSVRHSVKVKCWQNPELAEENTFLHDIQTGFSIHHNGKLSGPWARVKNKTNIMWINHCSWW